MFSNLIRDLLWNLDPEPVEQAHRTSRGSDAWRWGSRSKLVLCVCARAGVCLIAVVLTPFPRLALYSPLTSETQISSFLVRGWFLLLDNNNANWYNIYLILVKNSALFSSSKALCILSKKKKQTREHIIILFLSWTQCIHKTPKIVFILSR